LSGGAMYGRGSITEYFIEKKLGQGAMGTVSLVTRTSDGRSLALKRVSFADLPLEDRKQTLLEVALLSRLRHPNIVEYVDHFHDGDDLCIVMEVAPNDLLKELRRAKQLGTPIPEERLLSIFRQCASALHYAHSCRVLHRDVKPANVLLTADGTPKISDFGISMTVLNNELSLGRMLTHRPDGAQEAENEAPADLRIELKGTPAYMAPELFNHKLHVDGAMYSSASDVWALGVMMFELMEYRLPYEGASMISIVYKLVNNLSQNAVADARGRVHGATSKYSTQLCACVEGMLHKRPQQRATLPELLSREVVQRHARGGLPSPPLIDLLAEGAAQMSGRLPDCYSHGRGAERPRLRDDLMGIPVVSVSCGAAHCAAVAISGELYTWGRNDCGQLGHGDKLRIGLRRKVLFTERETAVRGVACGFAHTIAIAGDSLLYAWGSDKHSQLGLGSGAFSRADVGSSITIADDDVHVNGTSRAVDWGGNLKHGDVADAVIVSVVEHRGGIVTLIPIASDAKGQRAAATPADDDRIRFQNPEAAGLRDAMECVLTPAVVRTVLESEHEAWAVLACGEQHSAAITTAGAAYCWGSADDGRLGLSVTEVERRLSGNRVHAPRRLPLSLSVPDAAVEVAELTAAMVDCGDDFTVFVDVGGRLWGCGANYDGQLGIGDTDADIFDEPTLLLPDLDVGVDFVSCGASHTAAVDGLGRLWVWGGRFGVPPKLVRLPSRFEESGEDEGTACALVACGTDLVFAVTDEGDAFTWGSGEHGRLGLADGQADHDIPQKLSALSTPLVRVMMVACGNSVASTDEGPAVLVLAAPDGSSGLSAQFKRFLLADEDSRR